jgi:beta-lactamase superfamily II metal-dependent hydrolase
MNVKVTILNVKDGDAIIVELVKNGQALVMVIDSGEPAYYERKMKPALETILAAHNKKAPDIIVCTHYDSDHIGGLILLLEDYIADIGQVWVHKTPALLKTYIDQALLLKGNRGLTNLQSQEDHALSLLLESYPAAQQPQAKEAVGLLLETLPQLQQLIDLIPPSKLVQAFTTTEPLPNWPEVSVLGPTQAYYDSLFPADKSFEAFLQEEALDKLIVNEREVFIHRQAELANISACDRLKKDSQTKLTATNKASIIIAINSQDGKYLFTGDAGIESFKKIPDWQNALKDLYFLKVPHHGSNNNLSKELADLMQPVYAYCSGAKNQDDEVLDCLRAKARNKRVRSTKTDGDLTFDSTKPA